MEKTTDLFANLDDYLVTNIFERLVKEKDCRTLIYLIRTNRRFHKLCHPLLEKLSAPQSGPSRMSAYNVYVYETYPILKAEGVDPHDLFDIIEKQWKSLSKTDKMVWKLKSLYPNCQWK